MSTVRARNPTTIAAVLQGKLGKVKHSEDLLTSIVFGALAWAPTQLGIVPVLRHLSPMPAWVDQVRRVEVELWPWWNQVEGTKGAEPDVVLTVYRDGQPPLLLVIECKRRSGLGKDQLLRQAENGIAVARERSVDFGGVVYLTEHVGRPTDLDVAVARLPPIVGNQTPIMWLSWRDIGPVLHRAGLDLRDTSPHLAASTADAARCLERWGLVRFQGLSAPTPVPRWTFNPTRGGNQ
jgi:hypothetical protein